MFPFLFNPGVFVRQLMMAILATITMLCTTSVVAQSFTNCPIGSTCGVNFSGGGSAQAAWQGGTTGPTGTRGQSEGSTRDRSNIGYVVNIVGAPPGVLCTLDCTANGVRIVGSSIAEAGGVSFVTSNTALTQPLPAGSAAHNTVGAQSASNVALQQQFTFRFTQTPTVVTVRP